MKTTINIPDALLKEVRSVAAREHTTVTALLEEALRRITAERNHAKPFKLRQVAFQGKGLRPRMSGASWQQIRDASYEGQGA